LKYFKAIDRSTKICIIIILLLGLVPLTWYHPSYTIISGDNSSYWFNSPQTFKTDMNMWLSDGLGHACAYPVLAALFTPIFTLQTVGLSNGLIQGIVMSILLICSGLSMFFFLTILLGKKTGPIFVGSLFYMFSLIFLVNIFCLVISWAHAFLPLVLALFLGLIQRKVKGEPSGRWLVGFLFSFSFFMSFLFDNPAILVISLLSLLAIFLYLCLIEKFFKVIRETLKLIVPTLLVSLWWIIPALFTTLQTIGAPGQNLGHRINFTDYRGSILNIMWFNPIWSWSGTYYPYVQYYTNPIAILSTFVPFVVAMVGFCFKRRYQNIQYFFISIVLLAIAVDTGGHSPFGQLNEFLTANLPLFNMLFREPQSKFAVLIALFTAPLIACSVDQMTSTIKSISPHTRLRRAAQKNLPHLLIVLLCASIVFSVGPMFLGQVAETKSSTIPYSSYVKVPSYWNDANQFFIKDSTDFRVLITPDSPSTYMAYSWYWGADCVPARLIEKSVIYNTYGYQQKGGQATMNMTYEALENQNYYEFNSYLSVLNVKYILQRNDLVANFSSPEATNTTIMRNNLLNDTSLKYVRSFGELDIYEFKNWTATHLLTSTKSFDDNGTTLANFSIPNVYATQLSYKQISASEYEVHINASQPFFLFFSEGYDSKWKIVEANADWYSIPFSQDLAVNHTSAYGFGNMWYINKTGSYDLKIYYTPESYFSYGVIISVLSFSLITAYIGLHFFVKSREKRYIP
jgi:hypothetical protein